MEDIPAPLKTPTTVSIPIERVVALFKCPVCFDYMLPPILQCENGHLVCHHCHPRLCRCPSCRVKLGINRNLPMEKLAVKLRFPCKHSNTGCTVTLIYTEIEDHEGTCLFRHFSCPVPGESCNWQGAIDQVVTHLTSHKSVYKLYGEEVVFEANINQPGEVYWIMLQSSFNHHFMLVVNKVEKGDGNIQYFAVMKLIASRKEAKNFFYRLELNGHHSRLTWEANPVSIQQEAKMNPHCLIFDTSHAEIFGKNGILPITVKISRAEVM